MSDFFHWLRADSHAKIPRYVIGVGGGGGGSVMILICSSQHLVRKTEAILSVSVEGI